MQAEGVGVDFRVQVGESMPLDLRSNSLTMIFMPDPPPNATFQPIFAMEGAEKVVRLKFLYNTPSNVPSNGGENNDCSKPNSASSHSSARRSTNENGKRARYHSPPRATAGGSLTAYMHADKHG